MTGSTSKGRGKRKALPEDVQPVLELISEGLSLRKACSQQGVSHPTMSDLLRSTDALKDQYASAKQQRAEHYQQEALDLGEAAARGTQMRGRDIDTDGARIYLDAIKWAVGRMDPPPAKVRRHEFGGPGGEPIPLRISSLSDSQIDQLVARLTRRIDDEDEAALRAEPEPDDEA